MKNSDYWRGRSKILSDAAQKKADRCIKELDGFYRDALHSVQADLESWYGRFADNNGMSLKDARKMLNGDDLEEFQWSVEKYIEVGKSKGLPAEWVKKLENASAKFHVSRLEAIEMQIQQQIEVLYGGQLDSIDGLLRDVVSEGYTHGCYEMQKGIGVGWDITAIDEKHLDALLSKPWTGDKKTFRDRCWEGKANLVSGVQKSLVQALLRGDSLQKTIETVKKQFGVSRYKAGRLVHTETTYFNAVSSLEAYRELGVENVEIVETLDSRTCEICAPMDGKVIPLSQYEPGVTVPPFHPNCRGTTAPAIDDDLLALDKEINGGGERTARGKDGKVYNVPADMTYNEWKKTFAEGGSKDGLESTIMSKAEFEQIRTEAQEAQKELNLASQALADVQAKTGDANGKIKSDVDKESALHTKVESLKTKLEKLLQSVKINNDVEKKLFLSNIERLPVDRLEKPMTEEEIIKKLSGGDMTKGSCASVALAYTGNRAGLDVTDFRGGESCSFFSRNGNLCEIAELPGVDSKVIKEYNDFSAANKLLSSVKEGKEYLLGVGQHVAIIRKNENGFEYLELQSNDPDENKFKKLTTKVLKGRFACKKAHSVFGMKTEVRSELIDCESLGQSDAFKNILAYLNTDSGKQMKGASGSVK